MISRVKNFTWVKACDFRYLPVGASSELLCNWQQLLEVLVPSFGLGIQNVRQKSYKTYGSRGTFLFHHVLHEWDNKIHTSTRMIKYFRNQLAYQESNLQDQSAPSLLGVQHLYLAALKQMTRLLTQFLYPHKELGCPCQHRIPRWWGILEHWTCSLETGEPLPIRYLS